MPTIYSYLKKIVFEPEIPWVHVNYKKLNQRIKKKKSSLVWGGGVSKSISDLKSSFNCEEEGSDLLTFIKFSTID